MFSTTLNSLPILLTLVTGFGVMIHDTQLDHATVTALTATSAAAAHSGATSLSGAPDMRLSDQHVHTETIHLNQTHRATNTDPRLQTRDTDIKKYLSTKKLA